MISDIDDPPESLPEILSDPIFAAVANRQRAKLRDRFACAAMQALLHGAPPRAGACDYALAANAAYAVADANSTYGTTAVLGVPTLNGVLAGDTVTPTTGAFSGATPVTL